MDGKELTPRRLEEPDLSVLTVQWSPGTVHLVLDGKRVLQLAPETAALLAEMTRVCTHSALEADPIATADVHARHLLTVGARAMMTPERFDQLTAPAREEQPGPAGAGA